MNALLRFYPGDGAILGALGALLTATAVALLACLIIRRLHRDPSLRYAVSLFSLFCVLLAPAVRLVAERAGLPAVRVPFLGSVLRSSPPTAQRAAVARTSPKETAPAGIDRWSAPDFARGGFALLFLIWAGGVVVGAARFALGCAEARRLRREAPPMDLSRCAGVLSEVRTALDVRKLPPILESGRIRIPLTVGVRRPVVLLPEGLLERLGPEGLRAVLIHECAHIVLRHPIAGVVGRWARVLFWPHPLVHALARELGRAREEVCDNCALQGNRATLYARTLLAVAEGARSPSRCSTALGLFGPEWTLEERITGLLDPRRNRVTRTNRWKMSAAALALAAVGTTAAGVRVVAADEKTPGSTRVQTAGDERWCPIQQVLASWHEKGKETEHSKAVPVAVQFQTLTGRRQTPRVATGASVRSAPVPGTGALAKLGVATSDRRAQALSVSAGAAAGPSNRTLVLGGGSKAKAIRQQSAPILSINPPSGPALELNVEMPDGTILPVTAEADLGSAVNLRLSGRGPSAGAAGSLTLAGEARPVAVKGPGARATARSGILKPASARSSAARSSTVRSLAARAKTARASKNSPSLVPSKAGAPGKGTTITAVPGTGAFQVETSNGETLRIYPSKGPGSPTEDSPEGEEARGEREEVADPR